nr:hypothetical protein [Tanacetum cinerariifolium]
ELGWTPYASFGTHVGGSCCWNGADAVTAGAVAAHDVLPHNVPPIHSFSSILGPSSAPQSSPMREPTLVREPTPVWEPILMWEPTPDDHNKVAYLEKGKGWEAYVQIFDFLQRSHIRYALTHRPCIVFDSLVKQFWATTAVHNHEAGPSQIIANIDGNELVATESLIRTQLQLNDVDWLYEFTFTDVLDGMSVIGYPTDGSLTFYKAKLSPQ